MAQLLPGVNCIHNFYVLHYAIIIACIIGCWRPVAAKTWRVNPSGQVRSVQQGIYMAFPGDTILVEKGIYREKTIMVNKPVYLKGVGYPVLDGQKKYEILVIKADRVTVEGFALRHSGISGYNDIAAIRIYNAANVVIHNNKIDDVFFAIYCQQANNCIISKNRIRSNAVTEISSANGIHCWKCDSMQILNNTITGHRDGIYFEFVTNSLIRGNISYENVRYGLHFMFSHNDRYENNVFNNNGAGVTVMYSHKVVMLHNTFLRNWGSSACGILMKDIADSQVEANYFLQNTSAIYIEGSSRVNIIKNEFRGNGWALKIQASCIDNTITANNFISNTFDVTTNGSAVLNIFNGNYWDKYAGYDLTRDGIGDVPYRPVGLYSMVVEHNPTAMMLFRSFIVDLLDKSEKMIPGFTPENLKDDKPLMKSLKL